MFTLAFKPARKIAESACCDAFEGQVELEMRTGLVFERPRLPNPDYKMIVLVKNSILVGKETVSSLSLIVVVIVLILHNSIDLVLLQKSLLNECG